MATLAPTVNDIPVLKEKKYMVLLVTLIGFSIAIVPMCSLSVLYIVSDLGGAASTAAYDISFCLIGDIVVKPIAVRLGDIYGRVRFLKFCLLMLSLSLVLCICMVSYYPYLIFRFLAGIFVGPIYGVTTGLGISYLPEDKREKFLRLSTIALSFSGITALTIGGVLAYYNLWKVSFVFFILIGLILFYFLTIYFWGVDSPKKDLKVNKVGFFSYATAFIGLGFCLITAHMIDNFRSLAFNWIFTLSLAALLFFILWTLYDPDPLINFSLFKNSFFVMAMFHIFLGYFYFYGIAIHLSYWVNLFVSFTYDWVLYMLVGNYLGCIAIYFITKSRLLRTNYWFLFAGLFIMTILAFLISHLNVETNLSRVGIIRVFAGIALALHLATIKFTMIEFIEKKDRVAAVGLYIIGMDVGAFVGATYFSLLWERRSIFYHSRLGSEFTIYSDLTKNLLNKLNFFNFKPLMKWEAINDALNKQARTLGLDDCYYAFAWFILFATIVTVIFVIYHRKQERKAFLKNDLKF